MRYRLTNIASNEYWKQTEGSKTHTLTFRPHDAEAEASSMDLGMGGGSIVLAYTRAEAAPFELGALYDFGEPTPAN